MDTAIFSIKSHALLVYKQKGIFALGVIALTVVSAYFFTGTFLLPMLAFLVTTMPLTNFLFPSEIHAYPDRIEKVQLFYPLVLKFVLYDTFKEFPDGILMIKKRKKEFLYIFNEEEKKRLVDHLLKSEVKQHE